MKDLISIIVPVYNVEKYLEKCIESIVNQTYQNLEILLIDDGSTDCSGKICDEYAQKDKRIKVIHKENGGVSSARNKGLAEATGEYIGFVDGDDYIDKNMYEIMLKEIKKDTIEFVMCDFNIVNPKDEMEEIDLERYPIEVMRKVKSIEKFYPSSEVWRCLFMREQLKNVKFDEDMNIAEDLKFICHYILTNCKNNSIFIKRKLYYYVRRENSITETKEMKQDQLKIYCDFIQNRNQVMNALMNEKLEENRELTRIIIEKTMMCFWKDIYYVLSQKLTKDNKFIKKYYHDFKSYRKYYTLKNRMYMSLFRIHPKLFEFAYRNVRKMKKT